MLKLAPEAFWGGVLFPNFSHSGTLGKKEHGRTYAIDLGNVKEIYIRSSAIFSQIAFKNAPEPLSTNAILGISEGEYKER
jgi:hypothetical protein